MHIADMELGIIGANGIVAAGIPIAVGAALSPQLRGTDPVAVAFFGDGAANHGAFHESMNLAAVWRCRSSSSARTTATADDPDGEGDLRCARSSSRAAAYDMPGPALDGNDCLAVHAAADEAVARAARATDRP